MLMSAPRLCSNSTTVTYPPSELFPSVYEILSKLLIPFLTNALRHAQTSSDRPSENYDAVAAPPYLPNSATLEKDTRVDKMEDKTTRQACLFL